MPRKPVGVDLSQLYGANRVLIVGESHLDPSMRTLMVSQMAALKASGVTDLVLEVGASEVLDALNQGATPDLAAASASRTDGFVGNIGHLVDVGWAASAAGIRLHAGDTERVGAVLQPLPMSSMEDVAAEDKRLMEVSSREVALTAARALSKTEGQVLVYVGSAHTLAGNVDAMQTIEPTLRRQGVSASTLTFVDGLTTNSDGDPSIEAGLRTRPEVSKDAYTLRVPNTPLQVELSRASFWGGLVSVETGVDRAFQPALEEMMSIDPGLGHYLMGYSYQVAQRHDQYHDADLNLKSAIACYRQSARNGYPDALLTVARMQALDGQYTHAFKTCMQATSMGVGGADLMQQFYAPFKAAYPSMQPTPAAQTFRMI